MATWTSQAVTGLTDYLRRVEDLARAAGDDAEEISSGLREHIMRETEEDAGKIVTPEHLRKVLAAMGTPEEVIGADQSSRPQEHGSGAQASQPAPTAAAPALATNARSHSRWRLILVSCGAGIAALAVVMVVAFIVVSANKPRMIEVEATDSTGAPVPRQLYLTRDEAHAIKTLKAIAAAEKAFQAEGYKDVNKDGIGDYAMLEELMDPKGDGSGPPYEAPIFYGGYRFSFRVEHGSVDRHPSYTCAAKRLGGNRKNFYVDRTGVIRYTDDGSTAGSDSPSVNSDNLSRYQYV